jgi:2-oxoisovalerate dehydrogenase E2 component (dihydrolipoyl transacylase)
MGRFVFKLPDVGEGTAEAEIVAWHVKVGDVITEDANLVDVMTDKATVELTSPVAGKVIETNGAPGDMFSVGGPIVVLEVEGAGNAAVVDTAPLAPVRATADIKAEAPPAPTAAPEPAPEAAKSSSNGASDYVFRLPDVGEGTAEAEIVAWHVKVGDVVKEDAPLVDVMTDKATVEMTSPVAGTIIALHGEVGGMAPVGAAIVEFDTGKGAGALPSPSKGDPEGGASQRSGMGVQAAPAQAMAVEAATATTSQSAAQHPLSRPLPPQGGEAKLPNRREGEKPLASPAVRRRAEDLGVKLNQVHGSGPAGRITHEDLDGFVSGAHAPRPSPLATPSGYAPREGVEAVKVIGMRRAIARQMQESKRRIPHFAYIEEVDMTAVEELRAHLNATHKDRTKLTVLPFIMRALVKVLPAYPQINAIFDDEAGVVHRHAPVHFGIAAQTPQGLMVPVVRHAETLDLWASADAVAKAGEVARSGKGSKEQLSGSTITITSLGPLGGIATTPVINHPEVAIIGPNKIVERPVVRHGQVVVRKMMNISSSFDHRVVDGYDAAEFIQRVKALLENTATLFME